MHTLPIEVVLKIVAMLFEGGQNPVPQLYLRLAMVNRHFYSLFMSDLLWGKMDVHRVGKDIARHYLQHKAAMSRRELEFCGGFDWRCWRHPAVELQELATFSEYTQALLMAEHDQVDTKFRVDLGGQISNRRAIEFAARTRGGLWFASPRLVADEQFIYALSGHGFVTQHLAKDQRQNRELVLNALRHNDCTALEFCSEELRGDKELVLEFIYKWGFGLEYAPDLQDDREVALAAVAVNGRQLEWCSEALRGDREIVQRAVASDGTTLRHASRELAGDPATVLRALRSTIRAFEFVAPALQRQLIERGFNLISPL